MRQQRRRRRRIRGLGRWLSPKYAQFLIVKVFDSLINKEDIKDTG
jgi:hypothetical protein